MRKRWPETTLDAVVVLNRSGYWGEVSPSGKRPHEVKVIRNSDLTKAGGLRGHATRYFSEQEALNAAFRVNDVAMSTSGDVGKIWEVDQPDYFASNFIRIVRPNATLIAPGFLPLALSTEPVRAALAENTVGTTIQNLQKGFYSSARFALPPLDEQSRIVGVLDKAFVGIAAAKANAERNIQNARAVLESSLHQAFTARRTNAWCEKRLDEVAVFSQGTQVDLELHSTKPGDGLVRFIRIIDYTQGTDDVRYVANPGARFWVEPSDIVMVRYGTPGLIGRGISGAIANNLFKISPIDAVITNDFLAYFLSQTQIQAHLSSQGSSTMPALTFKQLGAVKVTFPLVRQEQDSIVTFLDSIRAETERLASLYERKLAALEALNKSLLHQAFTGEL